LFCLQNAVGKTHSFSKSDFIAHRLSVSGLASGFVALLTEYSGGKNIGLARAISLVWLAEYSGEAHF